MKQSRIGAAALCAALCVGTIQILTELSPLVLVIEPEGAFVPLSGQPRSCCMRP